VTCPDDLDDLYEDERWLYAEDWAAEEPPDEDDDPPAYLLSPHLWCRGQWRPIEDAPDIATYQTV
jgi:hypothetical protein